MYWTVNPWKELERMRRDMDVLFSRSPSGTREPSFPMINTYENKEDLLIVAELPGVPKEEVNITMENGVLTLSGARKPVVSAGEVETLRLERPQGRFEKKIRIPVKVNDSAVEATFNNGVLTIKLPKAEEARPKQITID
ncbi:MAG: Hsp20/alpha crystallin family protein [Chitinispirillaceae bacterium]